MLKIGIVGVGHFGRNHLRCLKQSSKFKLVGFYDIDADVCEQVQEEYGVQAFSSFEELIRQIDVLDIVTPASTHYDYTRKALLQNKHVFVEKPLATSVEEASELSGMLADHPVKLQAGHIERFNPAYTAASPYLDSPTLIIGKRFCTYNLRNKDVSVIEDLMIHDIDIVLQTIKSPLKDIRAQGETVKSSSCDIAEVTLEFKNGAIAHLSANRIAETPLRCSKFLQKDTEIFIDYMNRFTEINSMNGKINGHVVNGKKVNGQALPHVIIPEIQSVNAIEEELNTFYRSIVTNTPPPVTISDSLRVLELCEKIRQVLEK